MQVEVDVSCGCGSAGPPFSRAGEGFQSIEKARVDELAWQIVRACERPGDVHQGDCGIAASACKTFAAARADGECANGGGGERQGVAITSSSHAPTCAGAASQVTVAGSNLGVTSSDPPGPKHEDEAEQSHSGAPKQCGEEERVEGLGSQVGDDERQDHESIDHESMVCGACGASGHLHKQCPDLEEKLEDKRDWHDVAPMDLHFPKWELRILTMTINGMAASVGCVVGAARVVGCSDMYLTVLALVPCMVFQAYIFWVMHVNILSDKENKVWWRSNSLKEASVARNVLSHSHWKRSRAKARGDFADALLSTGWWEEAVQLKKQTSTDAEGRIQVIQQTQWLSEAECNRASDVMIAEAQLVPALFLRSREGMVAAERACSLQHFLEQAKAKLQSVVAKVSKVQLRKLGVVEPAVQKIFVETATNMLWPAQEDCYRTAIVYGIPPAEVCAVRVAACPSLHTHSQGKRERASKRERE